ncbi:holo-[acyl-carrier protein] synthase [[Emmonsia] crescens]|uniref:Holo-[acyl-carrier protein] synthase n=1 Tax=[Emmonsia] crescens TaxID=73230 RepID=A0A2B7ZNB1_9EURO|nr:holo-[acyl-carrier protein] synthase [Emmonsia crescens]
MKLIPFPFPLNIGTDIVHLPRIYRLIHRPASSSSGSSTTKPTTTYLNRFIRRILCEQELSDFHAKFFPPPHFSLARTKSLAAVPPPVAAIDGVNSTEMARWLAGRFAAKEAARKAAPGGASTISWKDVMVRVDREGGGAGGGSAKPEIVYLKDGGARGEVGQLSISHDGEYVVAMVLAATTSTTTAQGPGG